METLKAVGRMLGAIRDGAAIAQAGDGMPEDLFPKIQSLPEARHIGFGFFEGTSADGTIFEFCAGGAMERVESDDSIIGAWTRINCKDYSDDSNALYQALGIDVNAQESYLLHWQEILADDAR